MANQTNNSISLVAECLDYTLHSLISGKFSSVEEVIRSMVVDGKCCTLTSRYCDFFLLISKIVDVDNIKALSLSDLFLSIDALERKYKRTAPEDAWLSVKHDILFQIYLCELREAVGLPDDSMLPTSLEEFQIPDTVSVARYRTKVALLMEKYKGYYMQKGQDVDVMHPMFHQQKNALLYREVHQSNDNNGIQVPVLNKEKVFELLKTHSMNAFKEKMIEFIRTIEKMALPIPKGFLPAAPHVSSASALSAMRVARARDQSISSSNSSSNILNSDDEESLEDDGDYDDEEAAGNNTDQDSHGKGTNSSSAMKAAGEDSQSEGRDDDNTTKMPAMVFALNATSAEKALAAESVSTTDAAVAAARAQYREEAKRKDILERQQIKFAKLFVEALTEPPPADKEAGFEEYWQGEGWVNGIHYTRSWYYDEDKCKIGLIETDDKMGVLYDEIGMWQNRNVWDD